jgi:hypothetical protein
VLGFRTASHAQLQCELRAPIQDAKRNGHRERGIVTLSYQSPSGRIDGPSEHLNNETKTFKRPPVRCRTEGVLRAFGRAALRSRLSALRAGFSKGRRSLSPRLQRIERSRHYGHRLISRLFKSKRELGGGV